MRSLKWKIEQDADDEPFVAHGTVYSGGNAYDEADGSPKWSNVGEAYEFDGTVAVTDDTVFSGYTKRDTNEACFVAVDPDDGTIRWEYGIGENNPFGTFNKSPFAGGRLYLASIGGGLFAFSSNE